MHTAKEFLAFVTEGKVEVSKLLMLAFAYAVYQRLKAVMNRVQDRHFILKPPSALADLKVVGSSRPLSEKDIPSLVAEMRRCYESGVTRPVSARIQQLRNLKRMVDENEEEITKALKADLGRPEVETQLYDIQTCAGEIDTLIHNLADWTSPTVLNPSLLTFPARNELVPEPKGLVLVIGTWNFPFMLTLVPVAGAIAAGNAVILKPCNVASACSVLVGKLIARYIDPRFVSVVGQDMKGDRNCTAALLEHKFDHVFFTGSPSVGQIVYEKAARFLTPVTLELGGKNPVIVSKHCDVSLAAKRTIWGRMMNCGQQCIAPDYCMVQREVLEPFLSACKHWVKVLYEGDNKQYGRVVGPAQFERLTTLLNSHKGTLICGGRTDAKTREIEPTVLSIGLDSPAMADETFGPILLVNL